ncbi:hypothetical protein CCH79_00012412 [Gambusia affinis]|uniref:Apolipoprotein M n=1 Tax=Gambusia affinis TaxID=33528 RepID=A0A315WBC0_GAMAF|nr:hypothetical protein CCH79_00012412 [Gambusia affinis]
MLGRWYYIGGSSDIPGSRSLAYLLSDAWLDLNVTPKSNVLNIFQSQRIFGTCSSLVYDVIFENSTMLIEQPFYLKEVYLSTECAGCLVAKEDIIAADNFTSLLMFSRSRSVSPAALELVKKQAECLQMPPPIMLKSNNEICSDNLTAIEGLSALNSILEAKRGFQAAKFLDVLFDMFIN